MKRKPVKHGPRAYSELIRSDILGPSSSKSSRAPALRPSLPPAITRPLVLRPSPPSVIQPSHRGPPVVKPTRKELQARVEALSRKRTSVKQKPQASPERSLPARGKTPKLGASSPSLFAKEQGSPAKARMKGQASSPLAEVPKVSCDAPNPGGPVDNLSTREKFVDVG